MKYVVKLTYTNPAHEHVTLRRRVDTVNRIVEAASEQEALNRAANQQRALGFKIQEATIVEKEKAPVKTEQLSESVKDLRTSMKAMDLRHGVDADKREAGYKMSPTVRAAQAKSDALSKVVKHPQAGTLAAAKLRKEEVEYIEEKLSASDPVSKWISDFVKSDNPKFAGKSKKERINQALGAYYAAKRGDVNEGHDPSSAEIAKILVKKHGAGNVTKQHILDMEADRDSSKALDHDEIMKHVQKMSEEVEQIVADEVEQVEVQVNEANTRVVNKEVKKEKAAETAVAAARRAKNTKNKVETEPKIDMDVGTSEKKYVTKV